MAKKGSYIAWSPIRRLAKNAGAETASREAINALIKHLEDQADCLVKTALVYTKHGNRKKLMKVDIDLAIEYSKCGV